MSSRAGCKNRCRSSDEYLERFITTFELTLNSNGEWRANGDLDQTVAVDALIEIACAPRRGQWGGRGQSAKDRRPKAPVAGVLIH